MYIINWISMKHNNLASLIFFFFFWQTYYNIVRLYINNILLFYHWLLSFFYIKIHFFYNMLKYNKTKAIQLLQHNIWSFISETDYMLLTCSFINFFFFILWSNSYLFYFIENFLNNNIFQIIVYAKYNTNSIYMVLDEI